MCLYDFVANYAYAGLDKNGKRVYRKLDKPHLPNFKQFDIQKEDQNDSYYYAIILLFVPFRKEQTLVNDGETVEDAFNHYILDHKRCLKAQKLFRSTKETYKVASS